MISYKNRYRGAGKTCKDKIAPCEPDCANANKAKGTCRAKPGEGEHYKGVSSIIKKVSVVDKKLLEREAAARELLERELLEREAAARELLEREAAKKAAKKNRRVRIANSANDIKSGKDCEEGLGRPIKPEQSKNTEIFAALYLQDYAKENAYGCKGYMMYDFNSGQYCCSSRVRTPEEMIRFLFFMADSVSKVQRTDYNSELRSDAKKRSKQLAELNKYIEFIQAYFNYFIQQVHDQEKKAKLQKIYYEKYNEMIEK